MPAPLAPDYLLEWRVFVTVSEDGPCCVYAAAAPDPQVLDDLRLLWDRPLAITLISEEELESALTRVAHGESETAAGLIASLEPESAGSIRSGAGERDLLAQAQEPPVVRLVSLLLAEALGARASDVHIEASLGGLEVRYRIDGVLIEAPAPPPGLSAAVVSRLKVMADPDVAERRRPQDGRVRLQVSGRAVDVRVSTLPTLHGESVVLRFLEAEGRRLNVDDLGMDEAIRSRFEALLSRPHGVFLATGPTGSGKTTTLYGALAQLRTGREKIVTVEDPVEYALGGIAQVPVNRKAGVTFASALRSILRQDPDVLLVGEMRDPETAEICVQAALTGHLVLSTLHTNDAPSALIRLFDLGVEPYLVASTVEGVLAQRLVRIVCPECAREEAPRPEVAAAIEGAGFHAERIRRGAGCPACHGTGYRGRTGIYELLEVEDAIRSEVLQRRGANVVRQLALEYGMRPLRTDGWRQVAAGITTPEEVLRVTHG